MAVEASRINEILSQFSDRVESTISAYGLEHHKGTSNMNKIQAANDRFVSLVHSTFMKEETTEGMLYSAKDDAILEIENIAKHMSSEENFYLQGLGAVASPSLPADSSVWSNIISEAASRIDSMSKSNAEVIINMPKLMQDRLDQDFAKVLDAISREYNNNPSPGNANSVKIKVMKSLDVIESRLQEAADATMKANIETLVHKKMTQLQEKEIALASTEAGMTSQQSSAWRSLVKEVSNLILALGKSNFLVYDKMIRKQKLEVIDQKLALLETIRVNAVGVAQSLSGYFGNTGMHHSSRKLASIGGIGTSLGMVMKNPDSRKNFIHGIPPGFAGFAGSMSKDQITRKHEPGTAQAHIDATHYHMSQGLDFHDASEQASATGYTTSSHDKIFSIGGGPPLV